MIDHLRGGTLTLAGARLICDRAIDLARRAGHSISVAVSDPAGELLAFARMDDAAPLSGETARRKCRTVALTGRPSGDFGRMLASELDREPELFHGMLGLGLTPISGGLPLLVDDRRVGIVAVSGASSEDDEALAREAATAVLG